MESSYDDMLREITAIQDDPIDIEENEIFQGEQVKSYLDFIIKVIVYRASFLIDTHDIFRIFKEQFGNIKTITISDQEWLKNNGRKYYFYHINLYMPITDINKYTKIYKSYDNFFNLLINN